MLLRNRLFKREEPDMSAAKIYIFCEGKDREYNYFKYFEGIDSRLNLVIYKLDGTEDNSPSGLLKLAEESLIKTEDNPKPLYDYRPDQDNVWIVLDTDRDKFDSRKNALVEVRQNCKEKNWGVAQSNPCFEVWLYYHQESTKPTFDEIEVPNKWKEHLGKVFSGGFDTRKHPLLIQTAIVNAEQHFQQNEHGFPDIATTEVFRLAQHILAIGKIKEKFSNTLNQSSANFTTPASSRSGGAHQTP
ncbi:RloB family protein [Emticicia sp. 17c]|uniref:RloB family protein n=1 Tax=Emticicia sp. 17c TaxID=3127704 RepID=UPI00301CB580